MKRFVAALRMETFKVLKSKILFITIILFALVPLMLGLLVFIARNPELLQAGMGDVIKAKASALYVEDWPAYHLLIRECCALLGLIGFGFTVSWLFGREHIDRTLKDLLALPVSRPAIVIAKFLVFFVWCLILTGVLFLMGLVTGGLVGFENWSLATVWDSFLSLIVIACLNVLLCMPLALFAGISRGIILPLGVMIITLILAQFIGNGVPAFAPYFPWAIPGLYMAQGMPGIPPVGAMSYIIVIMTGVIGIAVTGLWWRRADHV